MREIDGNAHLRTHESCDSKAITEMSRFLFRGFAAFTAVALCAVMIPEAQAQNTRFEVKGVVADSAGVALPGATVVVLTRADSVLTKFAVSNNSGSFTLRRLLAGEYILQISFVGYQTRRDDFDITNADINRGTIAMSLLVSELDELVVSAEHIPFVVSRDTLSYNARAFQTRPNAVVEDLLRRLPGIEVEEDGTITAQGETVRNVLVEGKEFFGKDPTIATKNLPADAIERVQVYDKLSDVAEFTGIPDGEDEKTINLVLTEDAKSGYFGKISGGFGGAADDQSRYAGEATINRFTPTTQIGIIANANNTNNPRFAWGSFQSFMGQAGGGGTQVGGNLNNGFSETLALGLNVSHEFGNKSWIRSSYFLSSLDNLQDRVVQQQQLLGSDVSALIDQTSSQNSDNLSHNVNVNAQATFSEGHDMRLRGNLTASSSSLSSLGYREMKNAVGLIQNTSTTGYATTGDNLGGNAQLTWRKKLSENGRSIFLVAKASLNDSDLSSDLDSRTDFYEAGDVITYDEILQEQSKLGNTFTQSQRLSITQPFGSGRVLEVFGERSAIDQDQTKSVYDLASGTSVINDLLSSGFDRTYSYLRAGVQFSRNVKGSWYAGGFNVQWSDLDGTVLDQDEKISNGYTHILPWGRFKLMLDDAKSVEVQYRTSTREPTMTELQPFANNTNPLNIYIGNPALTPEYRHSINASYRFFDRFTFLNLFTSFRTTFTKDKIVLSRTVDEEKFSQVVTPVNSDGGWSSNGRFTFGSPIRAIGARVNLSNSVLYSTGSEFINDEENESRLFRNTIEVSLDNRFKDLFDIRAGSRLTYNNVNYSLNEKLNQSYVNTTYFARGTYYLGEAWSISTSVNYKVFDQEVFGPGQNIALLETSISRLLLNDSVQIELTGLDLLNQNEGVNFTNSTTFIQEERIESLGRYMMLKVTYNLKGIGSRSGMRGGRR